jgi:hypothetical protein
MERRNNVHKYQTYFQAKLVYLSITIGQQLLSLNWSNKAICINKLVIK